MEKYFKPRSLTFWASATPLILGVFLAFESVHGITSLADVVREATGGASAYVLINIGLAGIGLRGAIK